MDSENIKYEENKSIEIPLPHDQLILFDLDKTLINTHYEVTNSEIYSSIELAQRKGWKIGLSSDSPLEAMELWSARFGMNGPLIAEKGAIVKDEAGVIIDQESSTKFKNSIDAISDYLTGLSKYKLWRGNPVEMLMSNLKLGNINDCVIILNTLRQCSLSLFVKYVDGNGFLVPNFELTHEVVDSVRDFYPDIPNLTEDLNDEYGILIVSSPGINKRIGSQILMDRGGLREVGMIGDSINDYIGSDIAVHYAVSNASVEYKRLADYIAKEEITSGAIEILNGITK